VRLEYCFFLPSTLLHYPPSERIPVMRAVVMFVLSFVASTLGYMVTFPNGEEGTGWTTEGPQMVEWTSVDTDSSTFVLVLTNQQLSGFVPLTLLNSVTGSAGSVEVNPPSGGFIPGSGYRLNFMTSPDNPDDSDAILAQSNQFDITSSGSLVSSTSASNSVISQTTLTNIYGSTGTTGVTGTPGLAGTSGVTGTSGLTGASGSSSSSGTGITPTSTSGAASSRYPVQTSLLVIFSLLSFTLA